MADSSFQKKQPPEVFRKKDVLSKIRKIHKKTPEKSLFLMGIAKLCTYLLPAPSTSIKLHSAPPSSFQPAHNSLQNPQHYKNQNTTHNWAISPNLDQNI